MSTRRFKSDKNPELGVQLRSVEFGCIDPFKGLMAGKFDLWEKIKVLGKVEGDHISLFGIYLHPVLVDKIKQVL